MPLALNNPYTLGRGKLLVRKDTETEWHDFAHILNLVTNITPEKLEHFSVRGGLKKRDKVITTQLSFGGNCVVDVPILKNIKYFFMADTETAEAQSAGSWAALVFTGPTAPDRWIQIDGKYKIDPLTPPVITDSPATTTYVEDVDYEIDYVNGLLRTITGTAITTSQSLKITADYLADDRTMIFAGEISQQKAHVWFIGDPADGVKQDIRGFANLTPSGDLAMIGDEWQQFQLDIDFQDHPDYAGAIEYVDKGLTV